MNGHNFGLEYQEYKAFALAGLKKMKKKYEKC